MPSSKIVADIGDHLATPSRAELRDLGHRPMPPVEVIALRCIDCQGGSFAKVRVCAATQCLSWPFRTGFDPYDTREFAMTSQLAFLKRLTKAALSESALARDVLDA
jgi:hypothetical protein